MKIKGRKIIVWILTAVMILGLVPASAFADVAEGMKSVDGVNIVVFGNSSSNGFGMPDYWSRRGGFSLGNNDLNHYTKEKAKELHEGRMSTDAYPWRLKKYIAENEFDGDLSKVNLTSFALEGARIDEIYSLLDEDFFNTVTAREAAYSQKWQETHKAVPGKNYDGFLTTRVKQYYNAFYECGASVAKSYKAGNAYVNNSVKDADVIVIDACNNGFGTYIGFRLAAYAGVGFTDTIPNIYETIDDVDGVPESIKKSIAAVEEAIEETGILTDDFARQIVDAYIFSTASTIVNYSATVEHIRKLNPGAKIISVGIANANKGMHIQLGDTVVDMGKYLGELYEIINLYMRTMDKNADNVYYADLHGSVPTIGSSIAEKDTLDEVFADGPADGLEKNDKGETVLDEYGNPYLDVRTNYSLRWMYQNDDSKTGFNYEYLGGIFSTDPETGGETFYNTVLASTLKGMVTLKSWKDMKDDEIITGTPAGAESPTLYMAFDFSSADFSKMIKFDPYGNVYPIGKIDENNTTVYITKANIDKVVRRIYQLLLDGIHHNIINVSTVASMMANPDTMSKDIMQYIFGAVDEAPDDTLGLLYMLISYVMSSSIGAHPNSEGCAQKYEAVLDAYLSDTTAREQVIEEIRARIREICKEIENISKNIEEAAKKDIDKLIVELTPLIKELKEMGVAIYKLPEYEALVDSYADAISLMQETSFQLEDRVAALEADSAELQSKLEALEKNVQELEQQAQFDDNTVMQLKAKSVRVQLNTSVTFPSEKVKVTVSWDSDEDADGYVFKVNGAEKQPTATDTGFTYVDEAAQIGETYNFEVRPYVLYKGEQIDGDLFKTSVVPKVTLSKGVIKSLKKGTQSFTVKWKKVSGASGYQVSYKLDKKTSKKTVNGGNKLSLKVKNLKSGKKYTVKVRAWKKVNGKKYYGKWSKAKMVKVK